MNNLIEEFNTQTDELVNITKELQEAIVILYKTLQVTDNKELHKEINNYLFKYTTWQQ